MGQARLKARYRPQIAPEDYQNLDYEAQPDCQVRCKSVRVAEPKLRTLNREFFALSVKKPVSIGFRAGAEEHGAPEAAPGDQIQGQNQGHGRSTADQPDQVPKA